LLKRLGQEDHLSPGAGKPGNIARPCHFTFSEGSKGSHL
jgi:hypothetical protein